MRIAFFDAHSFERGVFQDELKRTGCVHEITFLDLRLRAETALLAQGHDCVCSFVNDVVDRETIGLLAGLGVKFIALRCAGFNHVDLEACRKYNIKVARVPSYSPHSVAEHALALILCLDRKVHRAFNRVRELNFSLDGLVGFDLYRKTVGVIGTGTIGAVLTQILTGLGCHVLAYDPVVNREIVDRFNVQYVALDELYRRSDIISLHCPLTPATQYLINAESIAKMKPGVMIINTGRGGLIDTSALIEALKNSQVGAAGLDVYEEEEGIFFVNLSDGILTDDHLARLLSFPNVLVTAHQAFLTTEALQNIAAKTFENITDFECGRTQNFLEQVVK